MIKYSATICASDSVAALTMIKPNKYPKLFSIVFGEGMINDAVAIILFQVVGGIFDQGIEGKNLFLVVLHILWEFIFNILASFFIGAACGKPTDIQLLFALSFSKKQGFWKRTQLPKSLCYTCSVLSATWYHKFSIWVVWLLCWFVVSSLPISTSITCLLQVKFLLGTFMLI